MEKKDLFSRISDYIYPGMKVLDLGAGPGNDVERFINRETRVTAVDEKFPITVNTKATWIKKKIENFITENQDSYDLVFVKNVFQYMDKEYVLNFLLAALWKKVNPEGILAIQTFYKDPIPAFSEPLPSLYSLDEMTQRDFTDSRVLVALQDEKDGQDLRNKKKHFFITTLIVKKITNS